MISVETQPPLHIFYSSISKKVQGQSLSTPSLLTFLITSNEPVPIVLEIVRYDFAIFSVHQSTLLLLLHIMVVAISGTHFPAYQNYINLSHPLIKLVHIYTCV